MALEIPRTSIERDIQRIQQALANPQAFNAQQLDTAKNQLDQLSQNKRYEVALYSLGNESLLARGRNHIVQKAMTENFDKVFFIDADEAWTPQQFIKILESPYPITAGVVPLKTFPIVLNYLPFKRDQQFCEPFGGMKTPESMWAMSDHYKSEYVKVAFTGTGFLCIDVKKVLNKLAETTPQYQYPMPATGFTETHWSFFNEGPQGEEYMSEDWAMCQKARDAGFDIVIDTSVCVDHIGTWKFQVPPRPQKPTAEQIALNNAAQEKHERELLQKLKDRYEPFTPEVILDTTPNA